MLFLHPSILLLLLAITLLFTVRRALFTEIAATKSRENFKHFIKMMNSSQKEFLTITSRFDCLSAAAAAVREKLPSATSDMKEKKHLSCVLSGLTHK